MANQRMTFGKRNREQNRRDKALAKQERLASRRAESAALRARGISTTTYEPPTDGQPLAPPTDDDSNG